MEAKSVDVGVEVKVKVEGAEEEAEGGGGGDWARANEWRFDELLFASIVFSAPGRRTPNLALFRDQINDT